MTLVGQHFHYLPKIAITIPSLNPTSFDSKLNEQVDIREFLWSELFRRLEMIKCKKKLVSSFNLLLMWMHSFLSVLTFKLQTHSKRQISPIHEILMLIDRRMNMINIFLLPLGNFHTLPKIDEIGKNILAVFIDFWRDRINYFVHCHTHQLSHRVLCILPIQEDHASQFLHQVMKLRNRLFAAGEFLSCIIPVICCHQHTTLIFHFLLTNSYYLHKFLMSQNYYLAQN